MTRYTLPSNGHSEEVSDWTWVFAFLFGIFYFMVKGLWTHVAIQIALIVVSLAAFGESGILVIMIMWIAYAFTARGILDRAYLRKGYKPASSLTASGASSSTSPQATGVGQVQPSPVSDDAWAKAMAEVESPERNQGLWARVFAQAGGDESKAKAAYISERVKSMPAPAPSPTRSRWGDNEPAPQPPPK